MGHNAYARIRIDNVYTEIEVFNLHVQFAETMYIYIIEEKILVSSRDYVSSVVICKCTCLLRNSLETHTHMKFDIFMSVYSRLMPISQSLILAILSTLARFCGF